MLTCLTANLAILHIFVSLKDQIKTKSLSLFSVKNYSLQKKKKKKKSLEDLCNASYELDQLLIL